MDYIKNVRDTLRGLSEGQRYQLALQTKEILVESGRIHSRVRPIEIVQYMDNFIEGKDTKLKYLEGFLEVLDTQSPFGGLIALVGKKNLSNAAWGTQISNIVNGTSSPKLESYQQSELITKEIQKLVEVIVDACVGDDEEEAMRRLKFLNQILSKKTDGVV